MVQPGAPAYLPTVIETVIVRLLNLPVVSDAFNDLGDLNGRPVLSRPEWRRVRGILGRTATFVIAAVLVLTIARSGVSQVVVYPAFATYIAVAAIWVRGQYVAAIQNDNLWTPAVWASFAGLVLALSLTVVGFVYDGGTAFIVGLPLTFFFLGYLTMGLRQDEVPQFPDLPVWAWALVLAALTAIAVVGLFNLESSGTGTLIATGLAVLFLPTPISVLSSRMHDHLTALSGPTWHVWLSCAIGAGGVLVAVGSGIALHSVRGPWMPAVIIVLCLLVFALVSSTYTDIAVIIALIALLGLTPPQQSAKVSSGLTDQNTSVLVAFGDSYMSGEGAKVFHAETNLENGDETDHCRRAPTAYSEVAGQFSPFDGFISFACSGAKSVNVYSHDPTPQDDSNGDEPRTQYPSQRKQSQLDAYRERHATEKFTPGLVLISLGGNDAGFATVGAMCLAPGNCGDGDEEHDGDGEDLLLPNLARVQQQLGYAFAEFVDEFRPEDPKKPSVPIAVVGYPDPIYNGPDETDPEGPAPDCTHVPLSQKDRDFVERLLDDLNNAVRSAAQRAGLIFIEGSVTALKKAHLQFCDPRNDNQAGVNIIGLQSVPGEAATRYNPQNWYHNSLHPNERGHVALLAAFERWLASKSGRHDMEIGRGSRFRPAPAPVLANSDADVQCDPYQAHDGLPKCDAAGFRWVRGQISDSLLRSRWGAVYLLIALGAWALSVMFFAQRRRAQG